MSKRQANVIFISLRFGESLKEATELKYHLEKKGYSCFLCDIPNGEDIKEEIIFQLAGCRLAIVMGTLTYGVKTAATFGTAEEMEFIIDRKKPFFMIKMCDDFQEARTIFNFPGKIMYDYWKPGSALPSSLISNIEKKLHSLSIEPASVVASSSPATSSKPHTASSSSSNQKGVNELMTKFVSLSIDEAHAKEYAEKLVQLHYTSLKDIKEVTEKDLEKAGVVGR